MAGLELTRVEVEARVAEQIRWANAVWCESERDASFVRGLLPEKPVIVIPRAIELAQAPVSLPDRRGVVIAALDGHDVIGANEDAALRALEDVLPALRQRHPALECTVLSDWPTPMLEDAIRAAGASLAPSSDLDSALASARLLVAAHGYGTGQPEVILSSLAAGTPFITTPQGAGGIDLGVLGPLVSFGDVADIRARAEQLLSDDTAWRTVVSAGHQLLASTFCAERRTAAFCAALASLGIMPGSPTARWPSVSSSGPSPRSKPVRMELRPDMARPAPALLEPEPGAGTDPYTRWVARYGPTPEVLRGLRAEVERLAYKPLISVLMPVYNTERVVLLEAIDSVRAQIYDHWQLCLANDGSTRPETLEVLASLADDPSVRVVNLPGNSGISEATNAALSLADGDFVALLDHDDVLKPHALAQVARWLNADPKLDLIYSDEDKVNAQGDLYDPHPHLKPDWSPDQLTSHNYVCHLTVARRTLVNQIKGFRSDFDGSQDYDLILRLTELTNRIAHIPEPLYSWRAVPGSAAAVGDAKPYAIEAAGRALSDALIRRGYDGRVDRTAHLGIFRVRYRIPGQPRVSVIIPTKNALHLLRRCVNSILDRSTYRNYELVVIDNESTDGETLAYLANFPGRVVRYPHRFNYARMMNLAARSVECDALLFLNNDTEVISPDWIESLLEHGMRPEVGAVGCRLFFQNGEPQHEGVFVGMAGWAANVKYNGYWARGDIVRNASAVTGACSMVRPAVYWRVGGNDERLRVAYNDVDLCLRIRQAGYEVVYTPAAELYHYEGASRAGYEHYEDGPLFGLRWRPRELGDPYYSPLMDLDRPFEFKT
jgi:glycosyltransferase involved in cell wall biosynthesis